MESRSSLSLESSTADADTEEDYDCPICQDIFIKPVRTNSCGHKFCKSCFETAVQCQGQYCPVCRSPVSKKAPSASDVQQRMRTRMGKCRACGKEKFLSKMRMHYRSCRKYIEEYGPVSMAAPSASGQTQTHSSGRFPNMAIPTADSALLRTQTNQLLTTQAGQSAGTVYSCPYCHLEGLRDMALVQHCRSQHAAEITPAVCPICMRMPWGNPHYCSRDLIAHMVRRHCYSYAEYMIVEEDEEDQFCRALQMSVQDF